MKKLSLVVAALLACLAALAPAPARADLYYVATATWTARGTGTKSVAFQNTSTSQSVEIVRIEVANAHDGAAVTSGYQQYWVYGSTQMTHGATSPTQNYALGTALASAPSAISFSTAPTGVLYELNTTAKAAQPLIRPLIVNGDETATVQLSDVWSTPLTDGLPIVLPAGASRGIVLEQRNLNATSYTAGVLQVNIYYRLR